MRRVLYSVLLITVGCLGANPPDALRREVTALRGIENLTAPQYAKLRQAAVDWVDGEIRSGRDVASINKDWMALSGANPSRFEPIVEEKQPLIRIVRLPITTNQPCGVDHTVLIYDRKSVQRIALLNANEVLDNGRYLVGIAVHRHPQTGDWTIASKWFLSWCTSNVTRAIFRVDRIYETAQQRVYHSSVDAMRGLNDGVRVEANADEVRFPLVESMPDVVGFNAVRRVSFGPSGTRESTYAKSLAGFLWQNIRKSWEYFEWDGLAVCPSEDAWEISIHNESRRGIYRVSGTKAENLRFDGERKQLSSGCQPIADANRAYEELMAEMP